MKNIYVVRWTDMDGRRQSRGFYDRQKAILFLNYLILDCSFTDAKLRTEKLPA
jgi:hypothetical protein